MLIQFHNHSEIPNIVEPIRAGKLLPEWYKQMDSYVGGKKTGTGDGETNGTIKKCMPVFDILTAGYLLLLPSELMVTRDPDGLPFFQWSNLDLIKWHPKEQALGHPQRYENQHISKLSNYWGITTPKGWSCLILPPAHHDTPIQILPAMVDTDTYHLPIQFPFFLKDEKWEGVIPFGTPIAQIIPIKRKKWISSTRQANSKKVIKHKYIWSRHIFDRYKQEFWNKKEYL